MAQVLQGENLILFFRKYADRATSAGARLKFQTEHSIAQEKETEATKTKDGIINSITDGESTVDITSLAYVEDGETVEIWKELRKWFKANELVEIWQVNLADKATDGKYEADYFQGYFTSFEISAPADGAVELSASYAINGSGAQGKESLSEEQINAIRSAQYAYRTLAEGGAEQV